MSRSSGTYTAPSNSWNPAVEGTPVDETDWNTTLQDIEDALTESVYTGGLGSTDNRLVRTDGTDTKKLQGSAITVDDSGNMSGVGTLGSGAVTSSGAVTGTALSASTSGVTTTGTIELGHASDTTIARSGAGDATIEGNQIYRAGGTDVALADGGTGASLSDPGADRIMAWDDSAGAVKFIPLADLTAEAAPATGDVVLIYGAEGDLRAVDWANLPGAGIGSGDVVGPASATDNAVTRFDGTGGKTVQNSGVIIDDSNNVSGANRVDFANGKGVHDANGNEVVLFGTTASAVNEFTATNAATGGKPVLAATGGDTNIIMQLQGKGTGGVEIEGTATNDSATAGYVGEVITANVAVGSAVSLTTNTVANVTSISLTAGDWDVSGQVAFSFGASTSYTSLIGAINTTSATQPDANLIASPRYRVEGSAVAPGAVEMSIPTGTGRLSLSATTTVYLVARATFTVSTMAAYGFIWARRAR
jgi:hypothetical protein